MILPLGFQNSWPAISMSIVRLCIRRKPLPSARIVQMRSTSCHVPSWQNMSSDGSVGDVKILKGLAGGLNDRAVQAVRQWRFSPAHRQGIAVDVIVEVAVEFKLR